MVYGVGTEIQLHTYIYMRDMHACTLGLAYTYYSSSKQIKYSLIHALQPPHHGQKVTW